MRFILVFLLGSVCFSASAQWYRIDLKFKKKIVRPEPIQMATNHAISRLPVVNISEKKVSITAYKMDRSEYSFLAAEDAVMKAAKHNMRFRVYGDASYNFSELARLYIQQNRFAEAKWFLLQSNIISRQQNDDRHVIANLIDLATIKSGLGDYDQAQQDLTEARMLAGNRSFTDDLATIDKKMQGLKQNRANMTRVIVRYAERPQDMPKAE
jgi:hypothetical protein